MIPRRWGSAPIVRSEATLRDAVLAMTAEGADLTRARLTDADLTGADLTRARLTRANLAGADLARADLADADLSGANLARADLTRARLTGADLTRARLTDADLTGADLTGATLTGADLTDATLTGARLEPIKADLWMVLTHAGRREAEGLCVALREGRVDGSQYQGACACLVGTLAKVRGVAYWDIPGLRPDSTRPSERWYTGIRKGDTPATNPIAALSLAWAEEWLARTAPEHEA